MMEAAMFAKSTVGTRVTNEVPNGKHFDANNSDAGVLSTGALDPISVVAGGVSIKSAMMQVDRPYGFVLAGVPLVIIKRKDGSADVYTTPA